MTDLAALDALIEAVTEGGAEIYDGQYPWTLFMNVFMPGGVYDSAFISSRAAYNGSLDAAKALHEALLPGWMWLVRATNDADRDWISCVESCSGFANVWGGADPNEGGVHFYVFAETPARAWLLAILKAYRAGL